MNSLNLFILGVVGTTLITVFNPFYVLPIFMLGHFIEPMQFYPELRMYNPAVTVGISVLVAWILHLIIYQDFVPSKNKQVNIVWLLILWALMSCALGGKGNWYVTILHIRNILPYFFFLYMIKTRNQVITIFWMLLTLGVIASLYGIYCAKHNIGVSEYGIKRIQSFFENPNAFGETLTLLIPFAIALLCYQYPKFVKVILLAIIGLLLLGVVLSYSRKCFFALLVAIMLTPFKYFQRDKKLVAVVATIVSLVLITYFLPLGPKYRMWKRVRTIFRADSAEQLDAGRTETAKAGWRIMMKHPVLGVGIGKFKSAYITLASRSMDVDLVGTARDRQAAGAHNVFIEVGAQLGIGGLCIYLYLVVLAFKDSKEAERLFKANKDQLLRMLAASLQVFIITIMIIGMFTGILDSKMFWIIIPLTAVLKRLAQEQIDDSAKEALS